MPPFRFAIPVVDRRGAGLGNELILWAKAFIAGQALNMQALHPAWGINRRRYWRYFQTSRTDYFQHQALRRLLPSERFDEEDYLRHGGDDYATALVSFAQERGLFKRKRFVIEIAGLWGGPGMLSPAREFIYGQLLRTRWTAKNLFAIDRRAGESRLRVGVHIRRGDFSAPVTTAEYAGKFNLAVPLAWYDAVMSELHQAFGDRVVFLIASDARAEELALITQRYPCITTDDLPNGDVSDLLALAGSDFLISSISSFSMWAAFLGRMPYAWFAPQLTSFAGTRSIWGHLPVQQRSNSPLGYSRAQPAVRPARGVAVGINGHLPNELFARLEECLALKNRAGDLIRYGVVPELAS